MKHKHTLHRAKFSLRCSIRGLALLVTALLALPVMAQLPNSFVVTVDKGGGEMVELNLSKYTVRAANCRIVSWDSTNGYVEEHTQSNPGMPARTYRGYVTENPNHLVLAVIHSNSTLQAEAHDGSGRQWSISGVDVTTELGNGTSTVPTPAPLASGSGTTVAPGLPGQYLPVVGLYRAHGVEDVPSQFYDNNGQSLEQTLVWLEHQWNVFDFFNTRDAKLSMELTEVIIRKEQFYFPTAGNAGQFNSMLRNEWAAQGQNKRGFVHSWFPNNYTYAGGYASGNEFYGTGHCISVNALYHEVGHNWRAQHYFYGRETMTGSHPSHGEMNTQRVLYTRQIQIDQDDGIEVLSSYATNLHPRAYQDVASTLVDTATNISPMANDYDANGDVLSIKSFTAITAKGGTVTESAGVLTYTPASGYVGKDIVVYEVQDTEGLYTKGAIHIEVINQGLAAHWTMDDLSGTLAADVTGNGHEGALVNADFGTASVPGPVGNALSLGSSAYLIGDDSNLITDPDTAYPLDSVASNFFDPMDESYTVATWIKLDVGTTGANIATKNNAANLGFEFSANTGSGVTATVRVWDGLQGSFSVSSGTPIVSDAWYHVAMVINRSDDTLRLYMNGAEVGTPASLPTGFFIFNGREDFKIGGAGAISVDDTRVYTKALDLAEVQMLHNAGEVPAAPISPVANALNQSLNTVLEWLEGNASYQHDVYFGTDAGAVAAATTASPEYMGRQSGNAFDPGTLSTSTTYFWRIDEVDGQTIIPGGVWTFSTAANALVNGLVLHLTMDDADVQTADGTTHTYDDIALPSNDFIANAATPGASGVIGQAVDLTGTTDSLRSYTANAVVSPASGGLTVSFWINTTSVQNAGEKVFDMGGGVFVRYYNGDLQPVFDGSSGGAITMDANINDGTWHHVVAQNDGAGTTTVYVDGSVIGTQSEGLHDLASLGREMSIGAIYNSTGENIEAQYDDFAIWQRTLSPVEIGVIYNEGLAGRSFNAEPVLINTSFEIADGFTGFTTGSASALGAVVDNAGVTWTEVTDVDIWNRTDIAPAGVQALVFGLGATLSQCDITIPGTTHGIGTASFDYASFSGGTDVAFRLLYNNGSGWVEAWSTQMVGNNPDWTSKPWGTAEVALNIPGDVDLRFEMDGPSGGMIDNVRITGLPSNQSPSFAADPFSAANAPENVAYSGTITGSASDPDVASVITYTKISGPAWLSIASDGTLSGTPSSGDVGLNTFTVEASDGNGGTATATLHITVDTAIVSFTDDFERSTGTALGNGWVEQSNDSRIFNTSNGATQMVISVSAGVSFAIVNPLADTYVVGESYELAWNAARATSANGTLNYDVSIGTWDGSTFTPLAFQNGSIGNLNLLGKTAGPGVAYTATATEAGQSIAVRLELLAGSSDWAGFDDVQLTVIGGNSAPTFVADPINKAAAAEDVAYVGSIGSDASDPDVGDSLSYSKVSGPAWLNVATDGSLTGTPVNGDVGNNAFTVRVTDLGGLTDDAVLNINVINSNDPPVASDNSASIAENVANGTAVVTVAASDPDVGDSLTYAITAGNTGGAFAIDNNGNITTATAIDYEAISAYSLTVTVTDSSNATDTANVSVTINNVNEAPVASDAVFAVAENAGSGAAVGTVPATDPDAGHSLTYVISAGNGGGEFAIDSGTGAITTTTSFDYESGTTSYMLTVTVTDAGSLNDTAAIVVNVTDVNEAPTANDNSGTVAEDVVIGTPVATVTSSDPDAEDGVTYTITAGNTGDVFAINATTGEVTTAAALDFETTPSYALTITATDTGSLTDTAIVTVTVTDVVEALFRSNWSALADQNPVADPSTYFDGTVATLAGTIDFEPVSGNLRLWNGGVGDKDFIGSGGSDVFENVIEVTSAQYANDTEYTLSYVVGTGSSSSRTGDWFVEFGTKNGGVFTPLGVLDSGSASNVTGSLTLLDTENLMDNTNNSALFGYNVGGRVLTVTFNPGDLVTGENIAFRFGTTSSNQFAGISDMRLDATSATDPNLEPVASDISGNVAENVSVGSSVATVSATDPNTGDTLSYAITAGNAGGEFAINNGTGEITTAAALDYEAAAQYVLIVTVTDDGTPALNDTATVTVNVTNINEAPVANDNSGSVAENTAAGAAIATVAASDVDAGDVLSYAITAGNTGNAFAIDSSGNITTTMPLDFETLDSYTLTVTVTDSGALSDTATVGVTVTDVVETTAPVIATGSASNLTQTSANVAYTVSDDGGEAPNVTLYYGISDGGTTPGNWASSIGQGAKATGGHSASLVGLTEGATYYFSVHASNSAGEAWGSSGSFTTEADTSPKLVRTTVSGVGNGSWTTVNLGQSYTSAVIIATPIYPNTTTPPVVTRITNVSGSSFDLKVDRADGLTDAMTIDVSIIAVEEGVYTQATDGVTMEAVKYSSTVTADNNSWVGETQTYQNTYTAPVVVGQVMSANDANWSVFYSMGNSRTAPASASVLNVGKHVGEDPNATRANETIGYIVIESGSGTINGVAYEAALGADTVRGFGNSSSPYTYTLSGGLSTVSAAAASISGMDGNNGAWAVLSGSPALTTSSIGLHALEDQMNDAEQSHTTTQVGYLIFE